jgi:hypothetical protein
MDRLTYRDDDGRAVLTRYGMQMYCSTQATADCFADLEEKVPRWISVKERLPELYQNVLVHYNTLHCVEPHNYAVAFRQNGLDEIIPGKHIWHVDSSPLELDGSDVTHWMPLPEPPKEGGGEDG